MQFQSLFDCLHSHGMSEWQLQLEQQLTDYFADVNHGDYSRLSFVYRGPLGRSCPRLPPLLSFVSRGPLG
ncbi:MAG: hypothetical protein AAF410_06265, partial [Pseudomonadota bacterium]